MLRVRAEIEPFLEEKGLGEFHINRVTNGTLQLVGPCGKPIFTMYGLEIPTKLTSKDREYVVKYIKETISKKLSNIKESIKLYKELQKLEDDYIPNKHITRVYGTHSYTYRYENSIQVMYDYIKDKVKYTFNSVTAEKIKSILENEKIVKDIMDHAKETERIDKLRKELSNINSCRA